MVKTNQRNFPQILRQRFSRFISKRQGRPDALLEIIKVVRQRGLNVFAFGGTPRGVFQNGKFYHPRDLDLVFDDQHFEFFESAFHKYILRRNSFGGLRLHIKDMAVDAWPLSATWAFRKGLFSNVSFDQLPKTTFLNADGIIIELSPIKFTSRRIYEAGFFSAWSDKVLDINLRENPYPAVCVARTLCISRRFGFKLSHQLALYLREMLATLPMKELMESQIRHYGQIEFQLTIF